MASTTTIVVHKQPEGKHANPSANSGNKRQIEYVDDDESNRAPVHHSFVVLTARSKPGERMVKIAMPSDANYKMVCGAVTTVGSTIALGSFPESSSVWCAVHEPARSNAYITLKVLALVDEQNAYETTVKRLQFNRVASEEPGAAWGDANPSGLLEQRLGNKSCTLTCPIPLKYTLCGGGFYSPVPIISSGPVHVTAFGKALTTKRESDAFGGGGWSVTAPSDDRLAVFAVGLRIRRAAAAAANSNSMTSPLPLSPSTPAGGPKLAISLENGAWSALLPAPHNQITVHLGGCNTQDPAAAALFLAPSAASRIAISRAPPSVWAQYHTPYRSSEDKDRDLQYTKATIPN